MGIILIPGIIFSIYAEMKVKNTFDKYKESFAGCGLKACEIARKFLDYAGLKDIQIIRVNGELTDYYNHKKKVIALSQDVYDSTSISAIGVACHEVGHALQYKTHYAPIIFRNLIIPVCNFANRILWGLILIGAFFFYFSMSSTILWIGIIVFGLSVLLNLVTLPVEYNASNRALQILEDSTVLDRDEVLCAKKVLNAAALTYVAGLVVSILNLLRLLIIFRRRND